MPEPQTKRQPTVFWQGVLILLPVAIMAMVATGAIVKDRTAVEQEMRQRAKSLLEQINQEFGNNFDRRRLDYESVASVWLVRNLEDSLFPPGDNFISGRNFTDTDEKQLLANMPAALLTSENIRFCPSFNSDGSLRPLWIGPVGEVEMPGNQSPISPAWRTSLTPAQAVAWKDLLDGADKEPAGVALVSQKFKDTTPGPDAVENADFIELCARVRENPTAPTVQSLLNTRFARSETGIPLSTLGLIEALKRCDHFDKPRELWDQVVLDARNKPNFMTPVLMELAACLPERDSALRSCAAALSNRWSALEEMWFMSERVEGSGKLRGVTSTNFWLKTEQQQWFCVLQPEVEKWEDGQGHIEKRAYTRSKLFPEAMVEWGLKGAFDDTHVTIPAYFVLTAELANGGPVVLSSGGTTNNSVMRPVMSQIDGYLPGLGNAPYSLQILVGDAALMLTAQRQRALMIGGLLVVSITAALIGFFAARRAFYRQLNLSEMKSNFVSSVSHELRAPIASVRLMAEGLELGKIQSAEKQHEYFRFIVQECRRLSSLIENVLDFSRIEQGRKQYEFESTNLVALVEQTVTLMQTYAAERQIQIRCEVNGEAVSVELEGKAMQQALVNLIDNAIKHSPKGAEVRVGLEFLKCGVGSREGGIQDGRKPAVLLWIEDKGEGMAAEEHEKIFERFYRIGSELRRETQGVGIGLSIVKHIVEGHGGKITVRSVEGKGSRFTIELPMTTGGES